MIAHVLYCHFKLAFLLAVYVFGSYFRTLVVIILSDFSVIFSLSHTALSYMLDFSLWFKQFYQRKHTSIQYNISLSVKQVNLYETL